MNFLLSLMIGSWSLCLAEQWWGGGDILVDCSAELLCQIVEVDNNKNIINISRRPNPPCLTLASSMRP